MRSPSPTQEEYDRMDAYHKMLWQRDYPDDDEELNLDGVQYVATKDNTNPAAFSYVEAYQDPAGYAAPLVHHDALAEFNEDEQAGQRRAPSPARPTGDANATPMNHD
jgi:hypothetical protein